MSAYTVDHFAFIVGVIMPYWSGVG
jgi:hypothetical protein